MFKNKEFEFSFKKIQIENNEIVSKANMIFDKLKKLNNRTFL